MRTTRAYLRIWAPAATVALALTLPWAGAQARDCSRIRRHVIHRPRPRRRPTLPHAPSLLQT